MDHHDPLLALMKLFTMGIQPKEDPLPPLPYGTVVQDVGAVKCIVVGTKNSDNLVCGMYNGSVHFAALPTRALTKVEQPFSESELLALKKGAARRFAVENACPALWDGIGMDPISKGLNPEFIAGHEEKLELLKAGTYAEVSEHRCFIIGYNIMTAEPTYIVVARDPNGKVHSDGHVCTMLGSVPIDAVVPVEPWVEPDEEYLTYVQDKLAPDIIEFRKDKASAVVMMKLGLTNSVSLFIPPDFADQCLAVHKLKEDERMLARQIDEIFAKKGT